MCITIDGYLVERKLQDAMKEIVGAENWIGTQVQIDENGVRRFRWDMGFKLGDVTTYVEFDGHLHYQRPENIRRDKCKDKILQDREIKTVRIPYWVQLTTETLCHYFGIEKPIDQDFPHGFIKTKEFPSSFCEMGIERFKKEIGSLPEGVRAAVISSLRERAAEHTYGRKYVIPTALDEIMDD